MGNFRLDRRRDAMRGGSIAVIAPGTSSGSRLYHKLTSTKYGNQMPPTGPGTTLPTAQELEQDRAFAVCMRAHGIQVSDPDRTGDMNIGGRLEHVTRAQLHADPGFKAALRACKDKLPAAERHLKWNGT